MDVAELKKCVLCGKGIMHDGSLSFHEITVRQCIVDLTNVRRMHGMEMMVNGETALARALSPDNTVAHRVGSPARLLLCQQCSTGSGAEVANIIYPENE